MEDDDIIADIRAYRDAYAAKFNYDIAAMVRDIQSRQALSGRVLLQPPPPPDPDPVITELPPPAAKAG